MGKIKLTKGELKTQRDALKQYMRYLPTLQLKKQQLQIEILHQQTYLKKQKQQLQIMQEAAQVWAGLLAQPQINLRPWVKLSGVIAGSRNIAGVDIPLFEQTEFASAEYDLFTMPLWVDTAIEKLREIVSLREHVRLLEEGIVILKQELRITAQRVNLFEKVKIPEAAEAIRKIKIYIGDQITNAVGRSKCAKRKIQALNLQGAI